MNLQKYKLSMAADWQKAYVKLAENADSEIQKVLGETEDGINILDSFYKISNQTVCCCMMSMRTVCRRHFL